MGAYLLRRLLQAALTLFGVMLLTFLLFNVVTGDVSQNYVSVKQGIKASDDWKKLHGLDKPLVINPDAGLRIWSGEFYNTQFWDHTVGCVTFGARSYRYPDKTLLDMIREKARYSLALTVPAMAMGWLLALGISALVAYYRATWIDRVGVFLSVLGMCVPFLAYMILGQWVMFQISPKHAWGLANPANIYVPVSIAVIAGLGASVRFYRTIILDQMGQDYVRTARAKGVPLTGILYRHVLKNCMLPILTRLIMSIPFLILGSLLLEQFFGVPGLGDLMISCVTDSDVPLMTGLTFLTATAYIVALLITDILYAVFDPRIRLR